MLNLKITIIASLDNIHLIQFSDITGGTSSYTRFDSNQSVFLDSLDKDIDSEKAIQQIKELLSNVKK